jgi:hypothetical protein
MTGSWLVCVARWAGGEGAVGKLQIGIPAVFAFSVGQSINEQPEEGWRGVVALHYGEGWIDVDTRYRWRREELLAIAGMLGRAWIRLRTR